MTLADRLNELCAQMSPALAHAVETGEWGKSGAPYSIEVTANGGRRIRMTDPESGDSVSASGATLEAALDALEEKLA